MSPSATDWSIRALLEWCESYLESKGVDRPRLDAEILLASCLEMDRVGLIIDPDRILSEELLTKFRAMIHRRATREPVSRILGEVNFFKEKYVITSDVLVPRPETEFLVEGIINRVGSSASYVVDVGTGSGCVVLSALNALPELQGLGLDISQEALQVAQSNARNLNLSERVDFMRSDLLEACLPGSVDIVVSNPPYVNQVDFEDLMLEVRQFDPSLALDGGVDGLDVYRRLLPQVFEVLKPGGFCGLEVGQGQAHLIAALGTGIGLDYEETVLDYSQIPRIVWFRRPSQPSFPKE